MISKIRRPFGFWEKEKDALIEGLDSGLSVVALAEGYGVGEHRMRQVLQRLEVSPHGSAARRAEESNRAKGNWLVHECRRKGVEPLDQEEMEVSLSIPDECPVLGIPLIFSYMGPRDPNREYKAVLSQIDPHSGWVLGNTEVISYRAFGMIKNISREDRPKISKYLTQVA